MRRLIEFIKKAFAPAEGYAQLIKQRDGLLSLRDQLLEENASLKEQLTKTQVRDAETLRRLRTRLGKTVRRADSLGAYLNRIQTLITESVATANAQEMENETLEESWSCPDHPEVPTQLVLTGLDDGTTRAGMRCRACDRRSTDKEDTCTSHDTPKP